MRADCQSYYTWDVAGHLLLGLAAAGVMANTSVDQDFQDWYAEDVRNSGTEDFAEAWKVLGDGAIAAPAIAGVGLIGALRDDTYCGCVLEEFGCRTVRGYTVGAPSVVIMQCVLGASRPGETRHESHWKPFDDANGVCGHGFIGAVPFITAAKMTDRPCLKGGLYLCSTLPNWARVDQDAHYLSQAWLGWWMAYLACSAVDRTETDFDHLTITPVATPEMAGIGVIYER